MHAHPFDELLAYVGFTSEDSAALNAAWPQVAPHTQAVTDRFYETIERFPSAAQVFADRAQVERLKVSLGHWLEGLFVGPHDHAYYERRLAIGRVHVRVKLPNQFMYTAMSGVRTHLRTLLTDSGHVATAAAVDKILDVELAIMAGTYLDESERDHMTRLRDLIVSHLPVCILVLDDEGRVTSATTTGGPFLRGNPIGRMSHDILVDDVAAVVNLPSAISRARGGQQPIEFPRVDVRLPSGRCSLRVTIMPVEHPLASTLVHLEDLTSVVAQEDRARNVENLASLGIMAASVAHEIRNPLAGISGVVQVVSSSLPADDDRLPALARVQEQIARLGELVGELLIFARPVTASMTQVDLRPVVDHACAVAHAAVNNVGVIDIEGTGSAAGDPVLILQVLQNLVQNAIQAGASRVLVRLRNGHVDVIDDGPGIPEEDRALVFAPFFTTKVRGTGLGLPMARRIAEAMNGSLELLPPGETGCHFRLDLPRVV